MNRGTSTPLPVGEVVRDTSKGRIGVVMGKEGPYFQLRPLSGGREWDVEPESILKMSPEEVLKAKLRAKNDLSTR